MGTELGPTIRDMILNNLNALGLLIFFLFSSSQGYNDDIPLTKWSPEYFQYRFFPTPNNFKRRMPSYIQEYWGGPSLSYTSSRPSWRVGSMGTMYKRQGVAPERCVGEGEACLFRGGLMGAAIKLNCCPGANCVFLGTSFTCVDESAIEMEREIENGAGENNFAPMAVGYPRVAPPN